MKLPMENCKVNKEISTVILIGCPRKFETQVNFLPGGDKQLM